jgi:hypothetical protein
LLLRFKDDKNGEEVSVEEKKSCLKHHQNIRLSEFIVESTKNREVNKLFCHFIDFNLVKLFLGLIFVEKLFLLQRIQLKVLVESLKAKKVRKVRKSGFHASGTFHYLFAAYLVVSFLNLYFFINPAK